MFGSKRRAKQKELERKAKSFDVLEELIQDYQEEHKIVKDFLFVFFKKGTSTTQRINIKKELERIAAKIDIKL